MEEETQSLFHWAKKMDIEQGGEDGQGRQRGGKTKWRWPQASLPHIIYYNNMFT